MVFDRYRRAAFGRLIGLALLSCAAAARADGGPYLVTPHTLASWLDEGNLRIVDTRLPSDFYLRGHIPGSVRISWSEFAREGELGGETQEDSSRMAGILRRLGISSRSTRIVVVGDAPADWGAAGYVVYTLRQWGLPNVSLLIGGLQLWAGDNRPVSRGFDEPEPLRETPLDVAVSWQRSLAAEDILQAADREKAQIVDVRSRAEFEGATLFGEKRGGRIPGALNIDWRDFLVGKTGIIDIGGVRQLVLNRGITPNRPVILYDTAGLRSAFIWCVLRHDGFPDVRLYADGFRDWAARGDLRIELPHGR